MNPPNTQLATIQPAELVRQSTDIASLCRDIVIKSSMTIQGRKYVRCEGWQSIATAHGCTASAKNVERVDGGYKAVGEIRRMSDGSIIAEAEGFVGEDEPTWFGGEVHTKNGTKTLPKRPDYAIRAMAQTRAISRACRTAFAHVVVLMDAGLATTPAEEVPAGGFDNDSVEEHSRQREEASDAASTVTDWKTVEIHFGKKKGTPIAKLDASSVRWYRDNAQKSVDEGRASKDDRRLLAALEMALLELNPAPGTKPATGRTEPPKGNPRDTLKSMLGFDGKTTEDELIAACHAKGMNSDVEKIDQMTDDEAQSAIKNFDTLTAK